MGCFGLIGWTWDNIVEKCLIGAFTGVVDTASGTLISNLVIVEPSTTSGRGVMRPWPSAAARWG